MLKLKDKNNLSIETFVLMSEEHEAQVKKYGNQNHDIFVWGAVLGEEVGELNRAIIEERNSEGVLEQIENEAIQVATVAAKIAQMAKEKRLLDA